jgi:hypothetical protein
MPIKAISNNDKEFNNRSKKSNKSNKNKSFRHNKFNNNDNENVKNNHNNYNYSKIHTYNVQIGESKFCLTSESLKRDAPNFFTAAFFGYFSESKTTSIFIERDPIYFSIIVRYLRGYEVDWPVNDKISMNNLLSDVKYYGFEKLQILLEEMYEKNFPEKIIPWKVLTYASEGEPVVVVNIKDVELVRWNSHSLIYDTNPILKNNKSNEDGQESDNSNNSANNNTLAEDNENNDVAVNTAADNDDVNNENNDQNNVDDIIKPNPEKGLYRLEIHGRDALATVTFNLNNGIKFENLTLKDSTEDKIFRTLTESFRTSEGSLTLTPSLKLPYLKDACIEIDGSKYYNYNDLSTYCGVTTKGKPLYFEEIVIRIDDGVFLMRARAWTIPFYYASQPFVCPVKSRKG